MMESPPPPPPPPPPLPEHHSQSPPARNVNESNTDSINPDTPELTHGNLSLPSHTATTTPIQTPKGTKANPSSSKSSSRFKFHSDTKAPTELSKIEEQNAQIVTAFRTRLNGIDKQIASWNARFSTEIVDRDRDMVGMLDYVCVDPLERTGELFLHRLNDGIEELWGIHPQIIEGDIGSAGSGGDGGDLGNDYDDEDDHDDYSNGNMNGSGNDGGENGGSDHINRTGRNMNNGSRRHEQNGERQDGDGATLNASASASASATATETNTAVTTLEEIGTSKDDSQMDRTSTNACSTVAAFKNDGDDDEDHDGDLNLNLNLNLTSNPPSVKSISRDISNLSSNLNYHMYTSIPQSIQNNLLNFQSQVQNNIPAHIQMERFKSSKREQSIHHKIDSTAGVAQKSLAEERATAHAELTILKEKVTEAGGWDEARTARFLVEIRDIREMLRRERDERVKKDELVLERIVETRELLHRTLLDSLAKE